MSTTLQAPHKQDESTYDLKVADAVWVATATLHRKRPSQQAPFTVDEIVSQVIAMRLTSGTEKSIRQHVLQHCEALSKPQPNRSRMLYATRPTHRRLFCEGDRYHPGREGAPTHPDWASLPMEYLDLKRWYEEDWPKWASSSSTTIVDPLLELAGTGAGMWGTGSADDYVDSLRSGWEASR
jgi:hypothetical protein